MIALRVITKAVSSLPRSDERGQPALGASCDPEASETKREQEFPNLVRNLLGIWKFSEKTEEKQ
jgi:hypothetical protein